MGLGLFKAASPPLDQSPPEAPDLDGHPHHRVGWQAVLAGLDPYPTKSWPHRRDGDDAAVWISKHYAVLRG